MRRLILAFCALLLSGCGWFGGRCVMPTEGRTVVLLSGTGAGEYGRVLQQQGRGTDAARFVILNPDGAQVIADDCATWGYLPPNARGNEGYD